MSVTLDVFHFETSEPKVAEEENISDISVTLDVSQFIKFEPKFDVL
jgi:hypothetical protein